MKRGQAAMEFLMTYGWAIFVILAAIGALAYFGVLSPDKFLSDKCTADPPFACTQYKVLATSSDNVMLMIQNGGGNGLQSLTVDLTCDDGQPGTPSTTFPIALASGDEVNATFTCATAPIADQRWRANYTMTWAASGDDVSHVSSGSVVVRAESS